MSRRTTGETTEDKEDDKGSMEWNRNKVGSRINDVITTRLTIIRTKARGNILGQKEMVAGDKGEHSYYKQKRYSALHSGGVTKRLEDCRGASTGVWGSAGSRGRDKTLENQVSSSKCVSPAKVMLSTWISAHTVRN